MFVAANIIGGLRKRFAVGPDRRLDLFEIYVKVDNHISLRTRIKNFNGITT